MSTRETRIETFEDLFGYFHQNQWCMIHCAVWMGPIYNKFRHHYIILGYEWVSSVQTTLIIHFTTGSKGKVGIQPYTRDCFERDIRAGLSVLENDRYPSTDEEFEKAYDRFEEIKNEKKYSITLNNCEHLANYILTGEQISSQIENLPWYKKLITFAFDSSQASQNKQQYEMPTPTEQDHRFKQASSLPN